MNARRLIRHIRFAAPRERVQAAFLTDGADFARRPVKILCG